MSKKTSQRVSVPSDALFDFLERTGGSLFQTSPGVWQYTVEEEGREGRTLMTHGRGLGPKAAIMNHHLYESNKSSTGQEPT